MKKVTIAVYALGIAACCFQLLDSKQPGKIEIHQVSALEETRPHQTEHIETPEWLLLWYYVDRWYELRSLIELKRRKEFEEKKLTIAYEFAEDFHERRTILEREYKSTTGILVDPSIGELAGIRRGVWQFEEELNIQPGGAINSEAAASSR